MVPLRQVFDKLSRVVRRLRRDLDKEVRLEMRGADTELDKLIVEELVDPLMHVVRNAFDHAIESAEERRAAGQAGGRPDPDRGVPARQPRRRSRCATTGAASTPTPCARARSSAA